MAAKLRTHTFPYPKLAQNTSFSKELGTHSVTKHWTDVTTANHVSHFRVVGN